MRTQAIVGGEEATPQIPLSPAQLVGIGAIEDAFNETLCTGVLLSAGWVLTAAHCDGPSGLWFRTDSSGRVPVIRRFPHSDLDAMLLQLAGSEFLAGLEPPFLALSGERTDAWWIGRPVTIVGFGEDENYKRGVRRFLSTEVSSVEGHYLVIDGGGETGTCLGDSGGPMLVEGDEGVFVAGILNQGSRSCVGLDYFQKGAELLDWAEETIRDAEADPCGELTWEGTCVAGDAYWCGTSGVQFEQCDQHRVCGWREQEEGYRCLPLEEDPCLGVGPDGRCSEAAMVSRCAHGLLVEEKCSSCGQVCDYSAEDRAGCY